MQVAQICFCFRNWKRSSGINFNFNFHFDMIVDSGSTRFLSYRLSFTVRVSYLLANTPNDCCATIMIADFSDRSIVLANGWFDWKPRPAQSTVPYGPAPRAMTPSDCWIPTTLVWVRNIFRAEALTIDYSCNKGKRKNMMTMSGLNMCFWRWRRQLLKWCVVRRLSSIETHNHNHRL